MKKLILVSLLLFLFISISSIKGTFSYYQDEAKKKTTYDVASWIVKVNDTDITLEESNEFSINDITLNIPESSIEGLKVSNEKFAPGTSGYFDILLDLSKVDTLVDYYLEIDKSNFVNNNIHISSVTFNDAEIELKDNKYTSSTDKLYENVLIRVNFNWELDGEDQDTGIDSTTDLIIPVTINVVQRIE